MFLHIEWLPSSTYRNHYQWFCRLSLLTLGKDLFFVCFAHFEALPPQKGPLDGEGSVIFPVPLLSSTSAPNILFISYLFLNFPFAWLPKIILSMEVMGVDRQVPHTFHFFFKSHILASTLFEYNVDIYK